VTVRDKIRDVGVGFRLSGRTLELTGPWSPTTGRAVRLLRPSALDVNYTRGFDGDDVGFLGDLAGTTIRSLTVVDHELVDLSPLERLAPQLEHLTLRTPSTQPIDLSRFPRLESYRGPWVHLRDSVSWGTRLQRLFLEGYTESDLDALRDLVSLTGLRLDRPQRLRRLRGILPGLRRLSVLHAPLLTDVCDVSAASGLQLVELIGSPSTVGLERLGECTRLEELTLSGCGPLPSLAFLSGLYRLRRLELLGSTPIADGDLQPLVDLPALTQVTVTPREHYRPSVDQVLAAARAKAAVRR
jgi:hypothetical protein